MTHIEIRQKFLRFFEERGHKVVPSSSLVPENDPTTLFTGSGMQPMMPYLLGEKHPLGTRVADSQKSFRAEDIEEVGDNRHTTFFEMLGNWSFGDYWKKEQLPWIYEFLIKDIRLDPNRLYVSVFSGGSGISRDDESINIWQNIFKSAGISSGYSQLETLDNANRKGMESGARIFGYGTEKNWWSRTGKPENMPLGEPGGPDSEIFFDFQTPHDKKFGEKCHPNCDCGRFLEIGNSVFMEYKKQPNGNFEPLPQRNVDFGGGLERMIAASNNDPDMFNINVLHPILVKIRGLVPQIDSKSERIIADHIRAAVFLVSDGIIPSNKVQGYFLRRLIRRALTYVRKSGVENDIAAELGRIVSKIYEKEYPELQNPQIADILNAEESKFKKTLSNGLKILESKKEITGKEAFDLFQTHGFPFELTKELVEVTDPEEFKKYALEHSESSTTASAGMFKGGLADHSEKVIRLHTATHLINAALRKVLGDHVWQKGSNITGERTRFDFTHPEKLTNEQKNKVENLVNGWVERNLEVKKEIMLLDKARELGALGVFGEKYPDTVSVYSLWDNKTEEVISREFCGGPHVSHTGEIGRIKIIKEEAISAGVRRIKAAIDNS